MLPQASTHSSKETPPSWSLSSPSYLKHRLIGSVRDLKHRLIGSVPETQINWGEQQDVAPRERHELGQDLVFLHGDGVVRTVLLGSVSPNGDIDLDANVLWTFYSVHASLVVVDLKMLLVHAANLVNLVIRLASLGTLLTPCLAALTGFLAFQVIFPRGVWNLNC